MVSIAFDEQRDRQLAAVDARHLLAANMARLAIRRGTYLRDYVYAFITTFASPLAREGVQLAMAPPKAADMGI